MEIKIRKPNIFTFIFLLMIFPFISVIGVYLLNVYNFPWILIGEFLFIPFSIVLVNLMKYKIKLTIALITTILVSLTSLIPLRGLMVAGDFGIEYLPGRYTLVTGHINTALPNPHTLVPVYSILNPTLSIITGIDFIDIFRTTSIIPSFLMIVSLYLIYKLLIENYGDIYVGLLFIVTQFFIIEACLWPSRTIYSLSLFTLLVYNIFSNRKLTNVGIALSLSVSIYYYFMGLFTSVLLFMYFIVLKALNSKGFSFNKKIVRDNITIYPFTKGIISSAIMIFTGMYMWYYMNTGFITSLAGHLRKSLEFLKATLLDQSGHEELLKETGIIGRELMTGFPLSDILTLGSLLLVFTIGLIGTIDIIRKNKKIRDKINKTSIKNYNVYYISYFILSIVLVTIMFSPIFVQGNVGLYRLYYILAVFVLLMVPRGLAKISFRKQNLYLILTIVFLMLNILANAKIYYFIFNEESQSIIFSKDTTNDLIWRVTNAELTSAFFFMNHRGIDCNIYGDAYSIRRPILYYNINYDNLTDFIWQRQVKEILQSDSCLYIYLDRYNVNTNSILTYGKVWSIVKGMVTTTSFINPLDQIYNNMDSLVLLKQ